MIVTPICFERECKHYSGILQPKNNELMEIPICKAFPKGIPEEILNGSNNHSAPLRNQINTIVYERR